MPTFHEIENMKIKIRRLKESTGKAVSLDVYINGIVEGKIPPSQEVSFDVDTQHAEVWVKTSWCESNRLVASLDSTFEVFAKGGLLGATFNSLFRPKSTYVLKKAGNPIKRHTD